MSLREPEDAGLTGVTRFPLLEKCDGTERNGVGRDTQGPTPGDPSKPHAQVARAFPFRTMLNHKFRDALAILYAGSLHICLRDVVGHVRRFKAGDLPSVVGDALIDPCIAEAASRGRPSLVPSTCASEVTMAACWLISLIATVRDVKRVDGEVVGAHKSGLLRLGDDLPVGGDAKVILREQTLRYLDVVGEGGLLCWVSARSIWSRMVRAPRWGAMHRQRDEKATVAPAGAARIGRDTSRIRVLPDKVERPRAEESKTVWWERRPHRIYTGFDVNGQEFGCTGPPRSARLDGRDLQP